MMARNTVLAFGTFDLLHAGHEHYLRRAKALGDRLVVVVARDATVRAVKGHDPVRPERSRLGAVARLPSVDRAVLGMPGPDKLRIVEKIRPDVIALGYDQLAFTAGLENRLAAAGLRPRIVRISAYLPDVHKSSLLRLTASAAHRTRAGSPRAARAPRRGSRRTP